MALLEANPLLAAATLVTTALSGPLDTAISRLQEKSLLEDNCMLSHAVKAVLLDSLTAHADCKIIREVFAKSLASYQRILRDEHGNQTDDRFESSCA